MPEDHVFAFPDTNIFLHFLFFTEIDWNRILNAKSVTLIIPRIVATELSKHKYSHPSERVKDRASKVTKKFFELLSSNLEVRPKVNIQFERVEPQDEFEKYNLSKDSQDDHLIASILRFKNGSSNNAVLITNDFPLMVITNQLNIDVLKLPEEYQIKSEENTDKKRIQKLEAELTKLKNKIPELKLQFSNNSEVLKCQMMSKKVLSDEEIKKEILILQEKYPQIAVPISPTFTGGFSKIENLLAYDENILEITLTSGEKRKIHSDKAREYNKKLEEYYLDFENYLNKNKNVDALRARTFVCNLQLNNDGNLPADDVDVFLYFPDFVKLLKEDDRFSYSEEPKAPKFPKPYSHLDYSPSDLHREHPFYMSRHNLANNIFPPKVRSWEQKIIQDIKGDTINFWVRNLKHGHIKNFENFCVIFSEAEDIKSFHITYRITAANLPKQIEGKLNVIVDNKKQRQK